MREAYLDAFIPNDSPTLLPKPNRKTYLHQAFNTPQETLLAALGGRSSMPSRVVACKHSRGVWQDMSHEGGALT